MLPHPRNPSPSREHFWIHASAATLLAYAAVLGAGFWHPYPSFQILPSLGEPNPQEISAPGDSPSLEIELLAPAEPPPATTPPLPPDPTPAPVPTPSFPAPPPLIAPPLPIPDSLPVPSPLTPPPTPTATPPPVQKPPSSVPKPSPPSARPPSARPSSNPPSTKPSATPTRSGSSGESGSSGKSTPSGVTLGSTDFPMPPYPPQARARNFEGAVLLTIRVQDGNIEDVSIKSSSGYTLLDATAMNWIRSRWHFPKQLTRSFTQEIRFQLDH